MSARSWPIARATVVELEPSGGGVERPVFRFVDATGLTRTAVGAWSFPVLYAVGDVVDLRYDPRSSAVVEPEVTDRPGVARLLTPEGRRQLESGIPVELAGLVQVAVSDRRRRGRTRPRNLAVGIVAPGLRTALAGLLVALGFVLLVGRMQLAAFFLIGYGFVLLARGRLLRTPAATPPPARDSYLSPQAGPVGVDPPEGSPPPA